jgi:transposase
MSETAPGEWRDDPTPAAVNRAKRRLGDGVEQAARIYLAHEGYDPIVAVSKQLEIGYETARKRIAAARKRGLVPKAPGKGQRSHRQED